jgi:nucleoside-diphosphate-sugar epimerase
MAKHLVTGGSGFLGNLIARRLLQAGHDVTVLDIWQDFSQPKEIKFIECDIRDETKVAAAMKGMDFVHHNVALVPLTKSGKDFWEVNVRGSEIASRCARREGVQNFVHMSSSAIYGAPEALPIDNKTPTNPIEIYGRGKLAGEIEVKRNFEGWDGNLVVIRPRTILGPGRLGIFQILFEWISQNRNIYTIGNGDNLFQFIHAHDLMDAYMLALSQGKSLSLNVGTNEYGTLNEVFNTVIKFANSNSRVVHLPAKLSIATLRIADLLHLSPLAPWHYLTYSKPFYFDTAELQELGWEPKYSNDEMFLEAYQDFLNRNGEYFENDSPHRKSVNGKILDVLKRFS